MLSTGQVAKLLGVTTATVSAWVRHGYLKAEQVGGRWVVHKEDLESFERPPMGRPKESKV